jgi:hypothetical protein
MNCPPILFIIFNRPELTARVFERIRHARPSRLFIAADGPREDHEGEAALCEETRRVAVESIDWDCEVTTCFRDSNLGCKIGPSSAITWFFTEVEEGIIIEDDCLPDLSFFPMCAELLERYRDDTRIMHIGGNNFLSEPRRTQDSYSFSIYCHSWGWATWRRAWALYDSEMSDWNNVKGTGWFKAFTGTAPRAKYFSHIFDFIVAGKYDTVWDYQWTFCCWQNNGLAIVPSVNVVSNIGFSPAAFHTQDTSSPLAKLEARAIEIPLRHPRFLYRDFEYEALNDLHILEIRTNPFLFRQLSLFLSTLRRPRLNQ